jgi:hypothetical protein
MGQAQIPRGRGRARVWVVSSLDTDMELKVTFFCIAYALNLQWTDPTNKDTFW